MNEKNFDLVMNVIPSPAIYHMKTSGQWQLTDSFRDNDIASI